MEKNELTKLIHDVIVDIWKNNIGPDYENRWLLKEDTLKNAFYFHLRNKLGAMFEYNNIRIFTEFTGGEFRNSGFRPDVVIAYVDPDAESQSFEDSVTECLAVIELKFKSGFTAHKKIFSDYEKMKSYVQNLCIDTKLYMATIWEYEDDADNWERSNAAWAKNRLTELNASYIRGSVNKMRFYVYEH